MTQKKLNKIKGSTVKPKADPVTTPIIDKEKEPNQDILQNWIPFFQDSNNIYVNDLAKRARRSSTHSSIINQKITFALGKEFLFNVVKKLEKQDSENEVDMDLIERGDI